MKVIKEERFIKELNRNAYLYIGLPHSYDSKKAYPVMYMHDGHNLFFKEDAFIQETWQIKEAFLNDSTLPEVIIVGLSCAQGVERLNEYGPFEFDDSISLDFGQGPYGGKGDIYLDYLVNILKPEIDHRFNTLKEAHQTAMMGASMGGVISLYAAIKYPHVFGLIASLSGSYFVSLKAFINAINKADLSSVKKIYLDTGDDENGIAEPYDYIESNMEIYEALKTKLSKERLEFQIISGGKHNEKAWAKRFPNILKTLFQD